MTGPAPKAADRRQRRNKRNGLELVSDNGNIQIPDPPPRLLKVTRDDWDAYWSSPLAEAVEIGTDLPAIRRLFTLRDERERAYRGYRKERFVKGSQGQGVLNPLARHMSAMDTEIRQLEDRLGLTPKARAQLGIRIGKGKRTLDDLNRALKLDTEDDPRAIRGIVE